MSRDGVFTVAGGQRQKVVLNGAVGPTTLVSIIPTNDPGSFNANTFAPREIVKQNGVGFTVNFIDQMPKDISYDYKLLTISSNFTASAGISQTVVADAAIAANHIIIATAPTPPAKLVHGDFNVQSTIKTAGVGFTVHYNNTSVNTTTTNYVRQVRTGTFLGESGSAQVEVAYPGLLATDFITVQASTIPGALSNKSYSVRWIEKKAASFVVYLNNRLDRPTTFDFVVL